MKHNLVPEFVAVINFGVLQVWAPTISNQQQFFPVGCKGIILQASEVIELENNDICQILILILI